MLSRVSFAAAIAMVMGLAASQVVSAANVSGFYLEARTCQVYTGPCFANSEVGLSGKEAVMAWSIDEGSHRGVDIAGLKVVAVVSASDTLGFRGIDGAGESKSLILVDESADEQQQVALVEFARSQLGNAGKAVVRVDAMPIEMNLDREAVTADLKAGKVVELQTRKARRGDCICSNESAYYPTLAKTDSAIPGVTIDGGFQGKGLGTRWTIPDSRSAYLGLFRY